MQLGLVSCEVVIEQVLRAASNPESRQLCTERAFRVFDSWWSPGAIAVLQKPNNALFVGIIGIDIAFLSPTPLKLFCQLGFVGEDRVGSLSPGKRKGPGD